MEDEVQRDHDPANTDPISVAKKHLYRSLPEFVVYFLVFALVARQIRRVGQQNFLVPACPSSGSMSTMVVGFGLKLAGRGPDERHPVNAGTHI
jgi:hypothetical protein